MTIKAGDDIWDNFNKCAVYDDLRDLIGGRRFRREQQRGWKSCD